MNRKQPFDELYSEHAKAVFTFVLLRIREHAEAEDVTADVFVAAFRSYEKMDMPDSPRAWLFSIAHNKVIDYWRHRSRWRRFSKELSGDQPAAINLEESMEQKAELEAILQRLSSLSERDQAIISLRVSGATHRQVGEVLGLTESAASVASSRAFARLQGKLEDGA
jgi:RNA polymerase sigma-70 factor (ECF subfamily)